MEPVKPNTYPSVSECQGFSTSLFSNMDVLRPKCDGTSGLEPFVGLLSIVSTESNIASG